MSVIEHVNLPPFFSSDNFSDVDVVLPQPELTLREAADILLVSESFMITLLDSGAIPCQKNGNIFRIKSNDLLAFKTEQKQRHMEAIDQLVEEGQIMNPNY
jgi:excisionase family DNA binding protein